ncbi:MAG: helicase-related protein, partial [Myxococcota bacterium]
EGFADGSLRVLVTAKVLNEGVDVPEARVGVVLSGSGSVREHVQRLGRILRRREGKRAVLYEVVSDVAAESGISERRRQHEAYGRAQSPSSEEGDAC